MAVRPQILYPGQVATGDPGYPHGKAQNVVVPGDGIGTPLERTWVNDLWGFLQSLLTEAIITPSGVPDTALVSQYLQAVRAFTLGKSANTIVVPVPIHSFVGSSPDDFSYVHALSTGLPRGTLFFETIDGQTAAFTVPCMPGFGRIRQVHALVCGNDVHAALPENMPLLRLTKSVLQDQGSSVVVAEQVDIASTTTAYDNFHAIVLSGLTETIEQGPYYIELRGESGDNARVNLRLGGLFIGYSA